MFTEPDERVRLDCRRHGIVLVRPLAPAVIFGAVGALLLVRGWPVSPAGAAALALGAVVAVRAVWRWERTRVVVTTEKLLVVQGTVRRRAAAVRLARLGAVEVEQSLAGRLLGYGTIVAGELEIPHVADPAGVARLLA